MEGAIDYYLQGVEVDPNHYELLYNIGCMYNELCCLKAAAYYFGKAYLKHLKAPLPLFGLAVVLNRLKEFEDSLEFLKECSALPINDEFMKISIVFLQAMNYRKLAKYQEATERYLNFMNLTEQYRKSSTGKLKLSTWGLLMVPLIEDRRKITKFIENLKSMMDFYTIREPAENFDLVYNFRRHKWYSCEEGLKFIHKYKFFRFFPLETLKDVFVKDEIEQGKSKPTFSVKLRMYK